MTWHTDYTTEGFDPDALVRAGGLITTPVYSPEAEHPLHTLPVHMRPAQAYTGWDQERGRITHVSTDGVVTVAEDTGTSPALLARWRSWQQGHTHTATEPCTVQCPANASW